MGTMSLPRPSEDNNAPLLPTDQPTPLSSFPRSNEGSTPRRFVIRPIFLLNILAADVSFIAFFLIMFNTGQRRYGHWGWTKLSIRATWPSILILLVSAITFTLLVLFHMSKRLAKNGKKVRKILDHDAWHALQAILTTVGGIVVLIGSGYYAYGFALAGIILTFITR